MIAFDLDGIFVNDMEFNDDQLTNLLYVRSFNMKPIFTPAGEYVIITGRPVIDTWDTTYWSSKFGINPVKFFHDNLDLEKGEEYKLEILTEHKDELNITHYIESSLRQTEFLKGKIQGVEIIHFAEFINQSLRNLYG